MPGIYRYFSKSQPPGISFGRSSRFAPTRTISSFSIPEPLRNFFTSSKAGVKHGRCSPAASPLRNTFVPYFALCIFNMATSGISPLIVNVRRYQNASRFLLFLPTSSKAGLAISTSPGTGTLCRKLSGIESIDPCAISHVPSRLIIRLGPGRFAAVFFSP